MASPTIDGHAAAAGSQGAGVTFPITLTTTKANDIIVVCLYTEDGVGTNDLFVTAVVGGGLTWQQRVNQVNTTGNHSNIGVWWALAPTALSAVTITVTLSGATDDYVIVAFGVNGCNLNSPWDTNVSIPTGVGGNAATYSRTINTTQANDFIVAMAGHVANAIPSAPAGFTLIDSASTNAAALDAGMGVWSKSVTATQTGLVVQSSTSGGGSILVVDSLTADGGTATATAALVLGNPDLTIGSPGMVL